MTNSIAQKFNVFSLLKFAFPTMVMMVFMSLYTIVDGIFVSRLVGAMRCPRSISFIRSSI